MNAITHHIASDTIHAWGAGQLPYAFSVVVASHLSMCDECRAEAEAGDTLGGAVLDTVDGVAMPTAARARTMAALDDATPLAPLRGQGIFPAPLVQALNGQPPKWRSLGRGMRQSILHSDRAGSLRLLDIPAGQAVAEHGHGGLEMTLVLQGSFTDSLGRFGPGDVEIAHDDVDHQPIATADGNCICLVATDAPLRFRALIPRLLQPLLRI